MKWFILIAGILTNASASVLIKVAMMPPRKIPSLTDPMTIVMNWPLWLGLALYGLAFLLYAAALARLPLNIAHPILTSGAIASVSLCSYYFFNEEFKFFTIIGIVFILVGVILISTTSS